MKDGQQRLQNLRNLLNAHQPLFRQQRVFHRTIALCLAELLTLGRHTLTQALLTLGLTHEDGSAWYRLGSRKRFDPEAAAQCLFRETLAHVPPNAPYVLGIDGVCLYRTGRHIPGTAWTRAPNTAPFRRGLQRAQRFVNCAWRVPLEQGYSRAIPLEWVPAFSPKSVPAQTPPQKEWEAGLEALTRVREWLNAEGRSQQTLLV